MNPKEFDSWLHDPARRPLVMGVLNVTPDSFSDGGRYLDAETALLHAKQMVEAGADWIDVGGESTRPGSQPVPADEQIRRVVPAIAAISAANLGAVISIDTSETKVAAAALDAGATVVNDISAGRFDTQMFPLVARRQAAIILMHMKGTPANMQDNPTYENVLHDVATFLRNRLDAAVSAGVKLSRILVDPGIGFGKTIDHNLRLLRDLHELGRLDRPIVIGPSRKGFIGTITTQPDPPQRVFGTAAAVAIGIANGASVARVHDVGPMNQVVRMAHAIARGSSPPP